MTIHIPVASGELFDKITILEIKQENLKDPAKLANVAVELKALAEVAAQTFPDTEALKTLVSDLKKTNKEIWDLEDTIRDCERGQDFGQRFVETARMIYKTNDRRAAIKREINIYLGSALIEEKSYAAY